MTTRVSTPMGDSLVVDWVFRSCVVIFRDIHTYVNLIVLNMVDFDVILGMDWLSHYQVVMNCFSKTITLAMLGMPPVVGQGAVSYDLTGIISYIYARRLILRGYDSYLAYIYDTSSESSSYGSVLLFMSFLMCSQPTSHVFPISIRLS